MKIQYENMWNIAKAVIRGKFITLNLHITKEKKSQIKHLSSHLNNLE